MEEEPPRRRQPATIGSPEGLHLPGVLPEPEAVEPDASEGEHDREILRDLEEALPREDRQPDGEAPAAEPAPLAPKPRAQLPWWCGALLFGTGGLLCLGAAYASAGERRWAFALVGIVLVALAARAWRARSRR